MYYFSVKDIAKQLGYKMLYWQFFRIPSLYIVDESDGLFYIFDDEEDIMMCTNLYKNNRAQCYLTTIEPLNPLAVAPPAQPVNLA